MSAPTRSDEPGLTRREDLSVSSAAMSGAPWKMAGATGAVVAVGPIGIDVIHRNVVNAVARRCLSLKLPFAIAGKPGGHHNSLPAVTRL